MDIIKWLVQIRKLARHKRHRLPKPKSRRRTCNSDCDSDSETSVLDYESLPESSDDSRDVVSSQIIINKNKNCDIRL